MAFPPEKIRNVAIIAHIDHGKTTLLDCLLKQANAFAAHEKIPDRVMDSYDQERERGITIFAKHTSIDYEGTRINIIDTPGHADFGGEVERVLGMVQCVLLLIDAREGPMPQTRFVLSKALKLGLKPIVVLNKIDRPGATPDKALDATFDLFVELGASNEQLDFIHCYASALNGYATREINDPHENMRPLFDLIVEKVPPPPGDPTGPFLMQVATIGYDNFLGRLACGRILRGSVHKADTVVHNSTKEVKITRIQSYSGLQKIDVDDASCGDIAVLAGLEDVTFGDTLCSPQQIEQLPSIEIEEPTVAIRMQVNTSPFAGREGKHVTFNKLRERLEKEARANITYRIDIGQDFISVAGRGELHLAVLIEAIRREGYEMSLGKPQVLTKEVEGKTHEPIEHVHIEVPEAHSGAVIEELSKRKGEMQSLATDEHGITRMEFLMPTRGLMGYRNSFLTMTRGEGILTAIFDHFAPWKGEMPSRSNGSLIATEGGKATPYALFNLQPRGTLFVSPTQEVYKGMIVGEHNRDNDLGVNVVKEKKLTNVRASGSDENVILTPPRRFTLEQAIDWIADDECIEVTPKTIRLRKQST
ncbi:MAG: translational GTPase TypA [Verrucomicrobia bacterium]|nr:translational GTPase TypA [Verrucomicrobiota bacterium]